MAREGIRGYFVGFWGSAIYNRSYLTGMTEALLMWYTGEKVNGEPWWNDSLMPIGWRELFTWFDTLNIDALAFRKMDKNERYEFSRELVIDCLLDENSYPDAPENYMEYVLRQIEADEKKLQDTIDTMRYRLCNDFETMSRGTLSNETCHYLAYNLVRNVLHYGLGNRTYEEYIMEVIRDVVEKNISIEPLNKIYGPDLIAEGGQGQGARR